MFDSMEKYVVKIRDPRIAAAFRRPETNGLHQLYAMVFPEYYPRNTHWEQVTDADLDRLKDEGLVAGDVEDAVNTLMDLQDDDLLYRGVTAADIDYLVEHGNTKHPENISTQEKAKLEEHGLDPSDVMYASLRPGKAWEYTRDSNPSILLFYDRRAFERVAPGGKDHYLYRIEDGTAFAAALRAILIIVYDT